MDCRDLRQRLFAYVDGELPEPGAEEARRHLESCAGCQVALRDEEETTLFLQARLRRQEPLPPGLAPGVCAALESEAATPFRGRRLTDLLASRWAPRLAMAMVFAVLVLVPVERLLHRTPALAEAAVQRHACHEAGPPGGGLPSCCVALQTRVGEILGEPSPGAVVPDLEPEGLRFGRATRCSYRERPVSMIAYSDAGARVFSLYITDRDAREFKLLPTRGVDGVTQARFRVAGANETYDVVFWERGGLEYTWVGPPGPHFDAALVCLQHAH